MLSKLRPLSRLVRLKYCTFLTELTGHQLLAAEEKLKSHLPHSFTVYGCVAFKNRFPSDEPVQVLVDKWPDFSVVICKPPCEELHLVSYVVCVNLICHASKANNFCQFMSYCQCSLHSWIVSIRCSFVFITFVIFVNTAEDNVATFRVSGAEKQMRLELLQPVSIGRVHRFLQSCKSSQQFAAGVDGSLGESACLCKAVTSFHRAPPGTSLSSLDESHVDLIYETWNSIEPKREQDVRNMIKNFPSCCLLDSRGRPLSWIITNFYGAVGMYYTHPDHRGKGYGRLMNIDLVRRLRPEGLRVFGFAEENNKASLRVCQVIGYTVDPLYRQVWFTCKNK
ncbi:glycine N-acyltransferase-like protein 3 [Eucyclogobius newberryi]|uniref:glycine N-acyltransferase-like protein 3 n=1 Tax=Eucyclogobius newberryi TaxID=166745 RepID=UPI003B5B1D39